MNPGWKSGTESRLTKSRIDSGMVRNDSAVLLREDDPCFFYFERTIIVHQNVIYALAAGAVFPAIDWATA